MKFKPGDPVWVRSTGHTCPPGEYTGEVIEVLTVLSPQFFFGDYLVHIPSLPVKALGWIVAENFLRPRTQGQDHQLTVEWHECPWQPSKEKVDDYDAKAHSAMY